MIEKEQMPLKSYGVLQQTSSCFSTDTAIEEVRNLGYTVLDSGYNFRELELISNAFDAVRKAYIVKHSEAFLKQCGEYNTIRLPLIYDQNNFVKLALNDKLISLIERLITGKFIVNQQNGIINPPGESYNQGAWHRDLPYQHFVSSQPLAINALFCLDDFTKENGATFVIPASHKSENFPSVSYIKNNSVQVEAKAGSFIVLDCMLYHAGGFNSTNTSRRGINHMYNIPFFKQQINIPNNCSDAKLTDAQKNILGFEYVEPKDVHSFLLGCSKKRVAEVLE